MNRFERLEAKIVDAVKAGNYRTTKNGYLVVGSIRVHRNIYGNYRIYQVGLPVEYCGEYDPIATAYKEAKSKA